ncbi:MAG: amino acid ABC transporter ATP-binding protein [Myxococcales bacterium]|nr:amino acid ABC transporter ATP-binding protein [Myxococcales bacterium]
MISVRTLCKRHGDRAILADVTADVARGEIVAIVGPSGGGKSTLLRCLNHLEPFDAGAIEIAGFRLAPGPRGADAATLTRLRTKVGMVFQQWNLFPHLTALANVTLGPRVVRSIAADVAERDARALLARVGLGDRAGAYPHELSGGQQQRVAIARALAQAPEVLLFDEPTSALDPEMTDEVVAVMRDLAGGGMTMLVVTHEMRVATELATRIWVIDRGTIVEDGPPATLVASPQSQVAREYFGRR